MKLILTEDVEKLGHRGDLVEVKAGFGRNFLLPQGLALAATEHNVRAVESKKKKVEAGKIKERDEAQALAHRIGKLSITIARKVGENDMLYGSVTASDVAEALAGHGIVVDRRKIHLDEPLKTLGVVDVPVKIHPEVEASVKVWVVKE